jgi:hypothetical protein
MPVIGPPPAGGDPAAYYAGVTAATALHVNAAANDGQTIQISNAAYRQLFSMTGGMVTFLPAGDPLPTTGSEPSPGAGSVVLQTWAVDITILKRDLPPGVPPMTAVLYLNVLPDTVRAALDPLVRMQPEPVLLIGWDRLVSPVNRVELEDRFLERLMLGQLAVFVPGGTVLGEMGLSDPANPASDGEFTLRLIDGAGSDLSPLLHLRGMPSYGGAQWTGHPLIGVLAAMAVPVNIYAQFVVWNLTAKVFEPLPAGIAVDLVDYNPGLPNNTLNTQNTDATGSVHFSFPDLQAAAGEQPDLFFLVHTNGANHAGNVLPNEWSTRGWKASDGSPGYYEDFTGVQLGDALHPLVFGIGLDLHVRFEYLHTPKASNDPAPQGVPVDIHVGRPPGNSRMQVRINEDGEIHCILFDVSGGDTIQFHLEFEIEDVAINLPRARVQMPQAGWTTSWDDADRKFYADNDRTSLGTQTTPEVVRITVNDRNVALYMLKIVRELSTFLFYMTNGGWAGVNNLVLFRTSISNHAYSWPVGEVNLPPNNHWDRSTIIHENSHQIMWQEVNFTSLGVGYEAIFGDLATYHFVSLLANSQHALIEGWAEFMEAVFAASSTPPYSVSTVQDGAGVIFPLGPPPHNRGESVEGAFANGLWALFQNQVVTPGVSANAHIPESATGDVSKPAPWIKNAAVRDRFLSMIWEPLRDMHPLANPTSTEMLNNIGVRNPAVWHQLRAELQTYNMAMAAPTLAAIAPAVGPTAGGQNVTLTGTNFVVGTTVTIGGAAAINIVVNSSTSLTADTPPGAVGAVDVIVTAPAGSATLAGGYTYA